MRLRQYFLVSSSVSLPRRSLGRWIVVAVGLGLLVVALAAAAEPYRQTREFRGVVACEQSGDCFGKEAGAIVGRNTYTTTRTDSEGHTTTTTHHEVTWQRADGSRETRDVSGSFYGAVQEGEPITLRLWRDEVVGVEVTGAEEWFLPESGEALGGWLLLAFFGLGVLLWGLLFGWWDGFFALGGRTFCWMFMGIVPVHMVVDASAYGLATGIELVISIVFMVFIVGIGGAMLFSSLDDW
jgi:hypothetical protein